VVRKSVLLFRGEILFSIVIVGMSVSTWSPFCFAQATFTVTPLRFEETVAPGELFGGSFTVTNLSEQGLEVEVLLVDWLTGRDGSDVFLEPGSLRQSLGPWISASPDHFTLPPGEEIKVNLSFLLPEDAQGDHCVAFIVRARPFEELPEETPVETPAGETTIQVRVWYAQVVKIIQHHPASEQRAGEISQLEVVKGEEDGWLARIEFSNTGNCFLSCQGKVLLRNEVGDTVWEGDIPEFTISPEASRVLEIPFLEDEDLPAGEYILIMVIDYGGDYLVAGQRRFFVEQR